MRVLFLCEISTTESQSPCLQNVLASKAMLCLKFGCHAFSVSPRRTVPLPLIECLQTCFELCRSIFGMFFAISDGDKCICGFESPSFKAIDTCDKFCAGDDSFTCGGDDAYELFHLLDEPTEPVSAPADDDGELGSMFQHLSVLRVGVHHHGGDLEDRIDSSSRGHKMCSLAVVLRSNVISWLWFYTALRCMFEGFDFDEGLR